MNDKKSGPSDPHIHSKKSSDRIGRYSRQEYLDLVASFHGHVAPGLLMGGVMVDTAIKQLPGDILFDAICETRNCLPDAVQLLTPCTVGNGWLKILNFGRFAICLYDKQSGEGFRVFLDHEKLTSWPTIQEWFFKLRPKSQQNTVQLMAEIQEAGRRLYSTRKVQVDPRHMKKYRMGKSSVCTVCGEAYPESHGNLCRACQGQSPYSHLSENATGDSHTVIQPQAVPLTQSIGRKALHDMTQIIPGQSKGPVLRRGQTITGGDLCRLQQMGRQRIYVEEKFYPETDQVHENEAASAFAHAIAGDGIVFKEPAAEGKIDFVTAIKGLLVIDRPRLERFNMLPGVMCATRKSHSIVGKGRKVAGTRAIPLFLARRCFDEAMKILAEGPLIKVLAFRQARVGILVTGTEIVRGLVQDRFIPTISAKIAKFKCSLVDTVIVADNQLEIASKTKALIESGCNLIITTAGLSVDPDDVTRKGLMDAGAKDILYGAPILPGAMTLVARIGPVQLIGVPACALFHQTTSFDLLLPRLLAGLAITREDLAALGHGAYCWNCKTCAYPKCTFGKE